MGCCADRGATPPAEAKDPKASPDKDPKATASKTEEKKQGESKSAAKQESTASKTEEKKQEESKSAAKQEPKLQSAKSASPIHTGKTVYHYFDVYGRGEVVRLMLTVADVPFEDHRFGFEDWGKLKPSVEFGQCPMLEIDGHKLVQTKAIVRYIAQKHGMYPTGERDIYKLESFIDEVCDIRENLIEHSAHQETEKLEAHYEATPALLAMLEKRLSENPARSGWVLGGKMTAADVFLFDLLWNWYLCDARKADHARKVPQRLKDFADFFLSKNQKVQQHLANRPGRPF